MLINLARHQIFGPENSRFLVSLVNRFSGHLECNMKPGKRRFFPDLREGLMDGIVGTDQEICTRPFQFLSGRQHQLGHTFPFVLVDIVHVFSKWVGMDADFRMQVFSHEFSALLADGLIAQCSTRSTAANDPDVFCHDRKVSIINSC
jgi:hypothetical protein